MGYKQIQVNILNTLCYSDIFNYPLTSSELWKYYIGERVSREDFYVSLSFLSPFKIGMYYALPYRKNLEEVRLKRRVESKRKIEKVIRFIHLLSFIPTIQLIGISGSVAVFNAKREDDIDLFFITKKDTLWLTRLIVTGILVVAGIKRKVGMVHAQDTICPNMFMTEDNLVFDKKNQNLFLAHEIGQLKVVVNKNDTYEYFLQQNNWVKNFLPNILPRISKKKMQEKRSNHLLKLLNKTAFLLQYIYMYHKQTKEVVLENRAAFHPINRKSEILSKYREKISTNERFWEHEMNRRKTERQPTLLASN